MATRADFYVMHIDGKLELLGCTSNAYDGDFEEAKTESKFRDAVYELLQGNNSIRGKWYWPWKHSKITDLVFVFKITPKLFNRKAGILLTAVNTINDDLEERDLYLAPFDKRYDSRYMDEETGLYNINHTEKIILPLMNQ